MKNIFNAEDNQELLTRLKNLKSDSIAGWGKMNVGQMVTHCQKPLEVAGQKLEMKRGLISLLFGKMMKNKLIIKGEDFKINLPTAKEFIIKTDCDFDREKSILSNMIKELGTKGEHAIKIETHPFFGKMSANEWGILFYKHTDHHLRQFGV